MNKFQRITLLFLLFFCGLPDSFPQISEYKKYSVLEQTLLSKGYVDIQTIMPSICVDLKYATTDNFTKEILYVDLHRVFLHTDALAKLLKAQDYLKSINSNYTLLVYDGLRPRQIQRRMYNKVKNTPYHAYVANPDRTGLHNYGLAVDLTIAEVDGKPLDMGTPFDYFGRKAGIGEEDQLIKEGKLTQQQVENRKLLRKVMLQAGFQSIRGEWWHFNAVPLAEAKRSYNVVE